MALIMVSEFHFGFWNKWSHKNLSKPSWLLSSSSIYPPHVTDTIFHTVAHVRNLAASLPSSTLPFPIQSVLHSSPLFRSHWPSAMDWNACVSPKFIHWIQMPNVMMFRGEAFRRWLDYEGAALMNGISGLIKKAGEIPYPFCHMRVWGEEEDQWGSGLSPDSESASALILDFQPPGLWEINFVVIRHPGCGILL